MARYIDADALIEHLKEYKTIYGVPMTDSDKQVIHYIIGHIKNIEPTAYDVEAVVAELEYEKEKCEEDRTYWSERSWKDSLMYNESDMSDRKADCFDRAISIVRGKE